ncbi:MAG: carbamoyl-phosphate synthase subunit L [Burkholderiales bacterium]|nr:carbamoyl-phosphate synthase subunit L [Burkholderiales bacterium]
MSFRKILVANRGEIACRVMRTAHRLGYRTVAVFSDADAAAPHVAMADEAVRIGPPPAAESYLSIAALLEAARKTGAEAVHPGYGFLSERADFARACAQAGLVFIGPPPEAIEAMGDKAAAKRRMREAGVPCAPGCLGEDQSDERLAAEARQLGLPLLVKAVAGGGGRGMRLVRDARDLAALPDALAGARREAQAAFGDGTLMLERLIEGGRHIEIQVFADAHGNAVHLGERDCTAQRRRQKVIEEAPSPLVSATMREAMGRDAVAAALAVGYRGAGTVEFIVDAELKHYFLEMNTRLQVEHPVTECITGFDLVEWQLRIAAGEPLPVQQAQITFSGHAIEARLYAEDPYDGWKPQTGRIEAWAPENGTNDMRGAPGERGAGRVRIDHGIAAGGEVTPYYDAMVAKFIAHGRDRADAIRRLTRALEEVPLFGPASNGRFLRDLVNHPRFAAATLTTTLLDEWQGAGEALLARPAPPEHAWRIAAALAAGAAQGRPPSVARFDLTLKCGSDKRTLRAPLEGVHIESHDEATGEQGWDGALRCTVDGVRRRLRAVRAADGALQLAIDGAVHRFVEASPYPGTDAVADPRRARAPVAGVVAQVSVAVGQSVAAGQQLVCVEAMKMEMWLTAGAAGTVKAVHTQPRASVAAGALLVELEIAP